MFSFKEKKIFAEVYPRERAGTGMTQKRRSGIILGLILVILIIPNFSFAASLERSFNIQVDYDYFSRNKIEAQLIKTTNQIYFYADKNWYQNFN